MLQCPPKEPLKRKADISDGVQRLLGRVATLRSGTPLLEANAEAAVPKTSRALIPTTTASQLCRSANVPRIAEPALITSLTIATRLPRSPSRSGAGILYPARKRPPSADRAKRSEYVN